jgi:uncharacterized phosphatase
MTTLFFVRHGETDWNRQQRFQGSQDIPLNDEGRAQARRLAAAWDRPVDAVVSSPLSRARETAEILAVALGLPIHHFDRRLLERSFGHGEGLTIAERLSRWPDGKVPGLEPPVSLKGRALAFLHEAIVEFPGRRLVAVSHGGLINAVLSVITGGTMGTGKTFLGNASVTTVVHDADRWVVREVGRSYQQR